jgi:hypothetical protein
VPLGKVIWKHDLKKHIKLKLVLDHRMRDRDSMEQIDFKDCDWERYYNLIPRTLCLILLITQCRWHSAQTRRLRRTWSRDRRPRASLDFTREHPSDGTPNDRRRSRLQPRLIIDRTKDCHQEGTASGMTNLPMEGPANRLCDSNRVWYLTRPYPRTTLYEETQCG